MLSDASKAKMFAEKYGWFVRDKSGERVIYYNGNSPGYSAYLGQYPDHDLTIVVLGNNDIPLATTIGEGLAALVLSKEVEAFPDLTPIDADQEFLRSVEGTYRFAWYSFDIVKSNNGLVYSGNYPYYEISLIPLTRDRLFNRFFWSNLVIVRDETGRVTHVHWEGNPQQKGVKE